MIDLGAAVPRWSLEAKDAGACHVANQLVGHASRAFGLCAFGLDARQEAAHRIMRSSTMSPQAQPQRGCSAMSIPSAILPMTPTQPMTNSPRQPSSISVLSTLKWSSLSSYRRSACTTTASKNSRLTRWRNNRARFLDNVLSKLGSSMPISRYQRNSRW